MKTTSTTPFTEKLTLGRNEAAALLGVSETTFWRLAKDPSFPRPVLLRGRRLWLPDELHAWLRTARRAV